jgi:DNA-binding transcriptional LysR family regulator
MFIGYDYCQSISLIELVLEVKMEAKHLVFFKRTAELENMTKAAENLMVSQPFLSRSIAELESELGVKLFDHVGRGIVLNPCGKAFYKRVINIINEVEDAKKEVRDIDFVQQSQVRVVTNVSLYMPGLFKLIGESNADLKIYQQSAKRRSIVRMLKNGQTDYAICCPPLEEEVDFETVILCFEPGVIIYPEGHWLKDYYEITFSEIENETFISVAKGYGTRDAIDIYFDQLGMNPKIAIETGDTSSVFKYVEQGLGIAAVPFSIALMEPAFKTNFARIPGDIGSNLSLSWRKNQYKNDTSRMFIAKTKEYFDLLTQYRQKIESEELHNIK